MIRVIIGNKKEIKYEITIIKNNEVVRYHSKNIPNNKKDLIKVLCEHNIIKIPYNEVKIQVHLKYLKLITLLTIENVSILQNSSHFIQIIIYF